jgi:MFS family permease
MASLVDRFGRLKLMLVVTTVGFSLASVLSGFASSFRDAAGDRAHGARAQETCALTADFSCALSWGQRRRAGIMLSNHLMRTKP